MDFKLALSLKKMCDTIYLLGPTVTNLSTPHSRLKASAAAAARTGRPRPKNSVSESPAHVKNNIRMGTDTVGGGAPASLRAQVAVQVEHTINYHNFH